MSAPNAGRQSPDPEHQSGAQQGDIPTQGSGKMDESKGKDEGKDDQTSNLSSNPTHILEEHAQAKTSKTVGQWVGAAVINNGGETKWSCEGAAEARRTT